MKMIQVAILDNYQQLALELADRSVLPETAQIKVFSEHIADPNRLVEALKAFDVICIIRERPPSSANYLSLYPI